MQFYIKSGVKKCNRSLLYCVKIKLALKEKLEQSDIIMVEEPETSLSFSNLNKLVSVISSACIGKQLLISTHSSFIANKIGIDKLILLNKNESSRINDLSSDTYRYFKKLSGYDTLRMILANKSILVEGPSDEFIVQKAYYDTYGKLPIEEGTDVISVSSLAFKRFLEIAKNLKLNTVVVTDNEGDLDKLKEKYKDYLNEENIKTIIVADKRQNTFDTHYSKKNKKYAENIIEWFKFLENKKLAKLNYLNNTWRCNQQFCDIADSLYPELPKSISKNKITTEHDGLFYVKNNNLKKYLNRYNPVVLAYGKNSCNDLETDIKTMNFGISKGLTFNRVIIKPTEKIMNFLQYGNIPEKAKEKLYIAITRVRYSVGFIVPNDIDLDSFYDKKIVEWCE